jgi:hypothetical protein
MKWRRLKKRGWVVGEEGGKVLWEGMRRRTLDRRVGVITSKLTYLPHYITLIRILSDKKRGYKK